LAIDERRTDFRPEIWRSAHAGQSVEQRWFPGVHTSIGGGYANDGLANGALRWMMDEAKGEGLVVDEEFLRFYRPWFGDVRDESLKGMMKVRNWMRGLKGENGDRNLKKTTDVPGLTVHDSAWRLMAHDPDYRPENLLKFMRSREELVGHIPADAA
jgi:hypothetical protein